MGSGQHRQRARLRTGSRGRQRPRQRRQDQGACRMASLPLPPGCDLDVLPLRELPKPRGMRLGRRPHDRKGDDHPLHPQRGGGEGDPRRQASQPRGHPSEALLEETQRGRNSLYHRRNDHASRPKQDPVRTPVPDRAVERRPSHHLPVHERNQLLMERR